MLLLLTSTAWACSACTDSHILATLPGSDILPGVLLVYVLARLLSRPLGGPPINLKRGAILTVLLIGAVAIGLGGLLPSVVIAGGLCVANLLRLRTHDRPWGRTARMDGAASMWLLAGLVVAAVVGFQRGRDPGWLIDHLDHQPGARQINRRLAALPVTEPLCAAINETTPGTLSGSARLGWLSRQAADRGVCEDVLLDKLDSGMETGDTAAVLVALLAIIPPGSPLGPLCEHAAALESGWFEDWSSEVDVAAARASLARGCGR